MDLNSSKKLNGGLFIMEIKEKIRKIYQKNGVGIREEDIEKILEDEEKTQQFMRLYKREELESMNYILGKPENNKIFTKEELELMNIIDLFNRKIVEICKIIWENKDNVQRLEYFIGIINESRCSKCI